jgi:hypothetical protein
MRARAALAASILIFVVGIAESAKTAIFDTAWNFYWREFQNATEASDAQSFAAVQIADPSYAIQFGSFLLNIGVFLCCKNPVCIDIFKWVVNPDLQRGAHICENRTNCRPNRQCSSFPYNEVINPYMLQCGGARSLVDTSYVNNNRLFLPNVVSQTTCLIRIVGR